MTTMKFLPAARWTTTAPAPRQSLTGTARPASERQMTLAAENAPLRITYGRDRIGAQIANVLLHAGYYVVQCVWGEGPIDAVESVTFADAAVPAGVQQQHYTGTAGQTVNSWLVDAFAEKAVVYEDALPYVAYSVFRIPIATEGDWSRITAVIRGRLLYDPRTDTTAYSTNPALALADYLGHARYGAGRTIDWTSVDAPADACDEQINGRARRAIGYTIDAVAPVEDHIETLRTYAGCLRPIIGPSGWRLIADRPASVVKHYDHAAGDILTISPIRKRGVRDTPTLIRLTWTDTSQVPWRDVPTIVALPGVIEGTHPRRESDIPLPGIRDASQAEREAVERLNKLTLEDIGCELEVFDDGVETEPGDVVTVSHPVGLSEKPMRVLGVEGAHGRYRLTLAEYDPAMYSDEIVTDPTFPDTSLPSPTAPVPPTGLTLTEELFQKQTGVYASRVRVSWTAPADFPHVDSYRVIGYVDGEAVFNGTAQYGATEWPSPEVEEGVLHTIEVRTVSTVGILSDPVSDTIEPLGKFLPPGDVPQITGSYEAGVIRLRWQAAVDIDIWRYELRSGASGVAWADADLVDRVDGLRIELTGYPLGTHAFIVRALDSVGLYSLNDARVDITVGAPAAVTGFTGFEVGGEARLSWNAVPGIGVANYEIRYGTTSVTWDDATLLNRTDTLRLVSRDVPEGTWKFLIKSISVEGFFSETAATVTFDVTRDSAAFLVDTAEFDSPTLSNMAEYRLGRTDTVRRFVTEDGVAWGTKFANAMSTYTNPLYTYGNVTSSWTSESYDFGQSLSGNWSGTFDAAAVAGTISKAMEVGPDGSSWTAYESLTAKTGARFARLKASAESGSFLHVTLPTAQVRIDAVPREETGFVTTLASGGALVQLGIEYGAAQSISLASRGTASRTSVYDRVLVAPATGLQLSNTVGAGGGNRFVYWQISNAGGRVIQPGDHLEYDVFIVKKTGTLNPGGMEIDLVAAPSDFRGQASANDPITGAIHVPNSSAPVGQWFSRKHSLVAGVGVAINRVNLVNEADEAGEYAAVYRNIRITDGAGNTRLQLWTSGEPSFNQNAYQTGQVQVQCGPSNSFLVYQFDSGGTQVAGSASWTFKGV
jgi:hypothetical protein